MAEKRYDFRKSMCKLHTPITVEGEKKENEISVPQNAEIFVEYTDDVIKNAVEDLIDFLSVAFNIKATVSANKNAFFYLSVDGKMLNEAKGYMGRRTVVDGDSVKIYAYDSRGMAQALYSLEDKLKTRKAPYLEKQDIENIAEFSPRMVHSGYGLDQYPDEYLSVCAHHGFDAIIVFVKDATHSAHGECDFVDIVNRAKKFGIDVYAYSYFMNFVHPLDEDAKEIYASVYGGLFEKIPGLKGIIFVGESIEFPSRDPHVVPMHHRMASPDGLPSDKRFPGWWPCTDYAEWLTLVRDSVHAVSPDADVVFWTYNFGYVEEQYRVQLIETLPENVSLLVTFEMFDRLDYEHSFGTVRDYTISYVGPSKAFTSEAKAIAKRKNIRLYSQANTAGRTWDYGAAPYEPFPYQWNKRNQALLNAKKEYGLTGLMESHHYGFYPSFISMLAKYTFTKNSKTFDERMLEYARYISDEPDTVIEALKTISEAAQYCTPSNENQYGPMRIGPAFPLNIKNGYKKPSEAGALFGNRIYSTLNANNDWDFLQVYSVRVYDEIKHQKMAIDLFQSGLKQLKGIKNKGNELKRLINLVEFLMRCHITCKNQKEFHVFRNKMLASDTHKQVLNYAKKLKRIAEKEIDNTKKTIPLVKRDSSIGYEASMLYVCDEEALLWKLKQMDHMLNFELSIYLDAKK